MLQFTKEVDYAIQLVFALSGLKKSELLSLKKFSKEAKISFLFLQRIAKKLREAGLIESVKGASGGYKLAINFRKITVIEIVQALEGSCEIAGCLKAECKGNCSREEICFSRKVFKTINEKICQYLKNLKLADIK